MCGEGFLNGQLTVTRGLGDFHPDALGAQRARERLKYRASSRGRAPAALRAAHLRCVVTKVWPDLQVKLWQVETAHHADQVVL